MTTYKVRVKFAAEPDAIATIDEEGKIVWTNPLPELPLRSHASLHQLIQGSRSFLLENGGTNLRVKEE